MSNLKCSIVSTSFIFAGILSQMFGPKYLTFSIPQFSVVTFGSVKSNQFLRFLGLGVLKGKFQIQLVGPYNCILYAIQW